MAESVSGAPGNSSVEEPSPPTASATTNEVPGFGWSSYAERMNGRFAMVGIVIIIAIELCTGSTVIHWLHPG